MGSDRDGDAVPVRGSSRTTCSAGRSYDGRPRDLMTPTRTVLSVVAVVAAVLAALWFLRRADGPAADGIDPADEVGSATAPLERPQGAVSLRPLPADRRA